MNSLLKRTKVAGSALRFSFSTTPTTTPTTTPITPVMLEELKTRTKHKVPQKR
jgi:hypothetical protein